MQLPLGIEALLQRRQIELRVGEADKAVEGSISPFDLGLIGGRVRPGSKRCMTPKPTSQSVSRLGAGSVGWPPRQASLSVWRVSGKVSQRTNALRMTLRTSCQVSRRPRAPPLTSNA